MSTKTDTEINDLKLRIRVAELCGYRDLHCTSGLPCGIAPHEKEHKQIPNYLEDLNAMHALEAQLISDAEHNENNEYCYALARICGEAPENVWWATICATARQRAEAFVITISRRES
jgi:hypothetical protein